MRTKLFQWILLAKTHRKITAALLFVLLGAGYWVYTSHSSSSTSTKYVLGEVARGTIVASVSASGQVSASNQLDIKPKVSGEILSVNVAAGQHVNAGQIIAVIDPSDAQKAVRDAQVNLESAQLSLDKLKQPADALSLIQGENSLAQASTTLTQAYDDGFNAVSNTFISLPGDMDGLKSILYGYEASPTKSQSNISVYADMANSTDQVTLTFENDAATKYQKALDAYNAAYLAYRGISRTSDASAIKNSIDQTYTTIKLIADAMKSSNDFLSLVKNKLTDSNKTIPPTLTTNLSSLAGYMSDVNSRLSSLLSIKNSIISSEYSIAEKTQSLADLRAGASDIDLQSSQLSLQQRQNALTDAQNALADYYVRAPFAGTLAAVNAKKYDTAGGGTAVATLITSQQLAELSLNEVDAAKVKVGDKATLTFDAIEGLTLTGKVAEVNAIGTVSQGVVSYAVKIGFDTQDDRIKPGMTVNASIQTDVRQDVLTLPSSAVKTRGEQSYVQVFDPELKVTQSEATQGVATSQTPTQTNVTVGISDDTSVEIVSGLAEGQQVVVRTVSETSKTTIQTTSSSRGFGGPGIRF